jgi:hypothetical protein
MDIADWLARCNVSSASSDSDFIRAWCEWGVGAARAQRNPGANKKGAETHLHVWLRSPADSARRTFFEQPHWSSLLTIQGHFTQNRATAPGLCVSQPSKDKLAGMASGTDAPKTRAAPIGVIIGMDTAFPEHLPELFPHKPETRDYFPDPAARATAAFCNSKPLPCRPLHPMMRKDAVDGNVMYQVQAYDRSIGDHN